MLFEQLVTFFGRNTAFSDLAFSTGCLFADNACKGVDCLHYITCCIYCIVGLSMAGIV